MTNQEPFIEDIYHALRVDISACGGNKVVGAQLWPSVDVLDARDKLARCVNPHSKEKLDYNEVLFIKRLARDRGSFATIYYECDQCELERPGPLDMNEEILRLQERVLALGNALEGVADDVQKIVTGISKSDW